MDLQGKVCTGDFPQKENVTMPTKPTLESGGSDKMGGATLYGVGIWNLHVIVTHDDGSWFAQAAEIDYAAQGESLDDVKTRFQDGLCATIHEHLKVYGHIDHFIQPAPADVWKEVLKAEPDHHEYSQVSFHMVPSLPFKGIEYILPKAA